MENLFIDLVHNFYFDIFFGFLIVVAYVVFSWEHKGEPFSRIAKDTLGAALKGFAKRRADIRRNSRQVADVERV